MCSQVLLGELGLLRGKSVSAYGPIRDLLVGYGANLVDRALVESGSMATASSCLAGVSLSDWIIGRLAGPEAAAKVQESVRPIGL